ncbi:MAG: NAD(P)/FAD-dependent oxidoreductase, partial [Flavobacteriaceae bacterium]
MINEIVDVLIIGAGPSGSVAASYLHNQGFRIKVVEKSKFPRFVIGESLLPRCMDHFEEVGLLEALKDFGFEVKHGARFMKEGKVCNFDFSKKHTLGWDWTWQVPRADFDKVLTDQLIKRGVDIAFEHEVTAVDFKEKGSTTTIKNKEGLLSTITAKYIIDSSGYSRVLPRLLDLDKPSSIPKHSSIFTHVKDINRPDGEEGTLITFDIVRLETWLWVIPFSNGSTSIGYVGPTEYLESFQGSNTQKLREMLKLSDYYYDRFKDEDFSFEPITIKNFSKSVKQLHGKGYALTGNSAEFLDPVFSSGVTFATESALLAAKLFSKELRNENVDWDKEYTQYIKAGVAVFETYVKEWYT